jgi:hypothetical protein
MTNYLIEWNGLAWVVTRVKTYRQDIVGSYPTNAEAVAGIEFQKSLDEDKLRDRRGY